MMKENPLRKLSEFGQSVWLDDIGRGMIRSGELLRMIEEDGLRGVTSNPSIFEKAIAETHDYDDAIRTMAVEGKSDEEIYRSLALGDVRSAADLFRPFFDRTNGRDGFVSLEVNPHLAHDYPGTVTEAHRLWTALDRPNVFIKVPATQEGMKAIRQLVSEGINVNVTLLFGLSRYREVTEAHIAGLEDRASNGLSVVGVASVASFFLSRIDVLVDPLLEQIARTGGQDAETASRLIGETAIACAGIARQMYRRIFATERWKALAAKGARTQRLLWASTGTKNPRYPDVKYVEALIGPDTVNTMPLKTLRAYRDHGNPAPRLEENAAQAYELLRSLRSLGIDLDRQTQQLEDEGIAKFNKPYDSLLKALGEKRARVAREAA